MERVRAFLENRDEQSARECVDRANALAQKMGIDVMLEIGQIYDPFAFAPPEAYRGEVGVYLTRPRSSPLLPRDFCERVGIAHGVI